MTITISVSNLGPIRSASVPLKPLTLFIGPNNAGKSVLVTVIYAALQKRSGLSPTALDLQLDRSYYRSHPGDAVSATEDMAPPWLDYILSARSDGARLDDDDFAACVELKGGRVEAGIVSGQLQNAAALIEKIATGVQG